MAKLKIGSKITSGIKTVFNAVKKVSLKVTAPVRNNSVWKKARRTFLKSPFKGYFVRSYGELKKVEWPDRKTSWKLTGTVIAFSVVFAVFTTVIDLGFEKLAKALFIN